ncbi:uncharacterized protein LOC120856504 [Oryx dammah]|uniref:uncharacterized protein LOC120856504 n=1 Tax=Oryx dammah TaxID=59534 RepID=UPI001A9BFEA4|nr:uncharacterized protein LOC120856504 [Oryx dammah]
MTRRLRPCPRPACPLGACDASLFPTGHPRSLLSRQDTPSPTASCARGSGHILSLCLPSSIPSGDLGPCPSPSCEVREELGKQDLVVRRPSCQTGLPSRIFQVSVRSPGSFRERCSAAVRRPHRQEWGRGFRNLPQPSPPCRSPPGQLSCLSLPACRAWRAQASCGGPGSPPMQLAQCLREGCSGRNEMGGVRLSGLPQTSQGGGAGLGSSSKPSCRVDTGREFAKERPVPAGLPVCACCPEPREGLAGGTLRPQCSAQPKPQSSILTPQGVHVLICEMGVWCGPTHPQGPGKGGLRPPRGSLSRDDSGTLQLCQYFKEHVLRSTALAPGSHKHLVRC